MAGPNLEHGTSYPRRQQDSDHGYLSLPFFSHYTDLGFTSCAEGQVSSPGLSTLGSRFPDRVPDVAAVMLVTCRRLKWQLFDVPLKTAHGKGMDISRADNQAVPRSIPQSYTWPCKLDGDARTEGKNQRKVQKIYIKNNQKKIDDRFAGNPCGQLIAILEGKTGHVRPGMHAGTLLLIPFRGKQTLAGTARTVIRHQGLLCINRWAVCTGRKRQTHPWQDLRQVGKEKK